MSVAAGLSLVTTQIPLKMQIATKKHRRRFGSSRSSSKWVLYLHAYDRFPVTVLTCPRPRPLRWKSPPLCVLPGHQSHSTMYKHKKAHQGNWGFNNQRLAARRDRWFQMEVQGQRERGGGGGGAIRERARNAPGVRSSWPDISCPPTPSHTRVTCWSSDCGATCSLWPNERFNFKICTQHHFHLLS